MWLYTSSGFLSVVEDRSDPNKLYVRSRESAVFEDLFKGFEVIHTPNADYEWRVHVDKGEFGTILYNEIFNIDYDNFKDHVKVASPHLEYCYNRVYYATYTLGEDDERVRFVAIN